MHNLGIGAHLITTEIAWDGGEPVAFEHFITIVPRRHSDIDE